MSFLPEIQLMMHGFGDARRALRESAALVETVVHQQMISLLHQALEGCEARGARDISPEDILFIVRHDRVKLQRLLHYLGELWLHYLGELWLHYLGELWLHYLAVRDESRELQRTVGPGDPADVTNGESGEPLSRKKQCVNFLQSIDQFGQYEPVYTYSLPDPGKLDRAYRLDAFTKHMSSGRYKEFCEARRASFCPSLKVGKFRDWLLADQSPDIKLTQCGVVNCRGNYNKENRRRVFRLPKEQSERQKIFIVPASCLPSPKPAPRPAKVEDQQLRYFLQKDKITSFDVFKPERNLQKQYKNLIISRSKERLVCLFMTDNFSECSLSVVVENKPTLCSALTFSAFKNGISVPLFKTLHPNNSLRSYT
ncbi:Transcription initiation factor IID subunit 13 [Trinorchestia longiramus]|nr:Transcription initiation factor IID subunit 13 [Trinorchestia longiramus]